MVTANSSITGFFAMLGAVATASPKWEEISTASSSSTPFGSKGFGALMGRELAKGSYVFKGKGGTGPPAREVKGPGSQFGVDGLGRLKALEELNSGQTVAIGGELQVLFHTLQAMDSANTPDELVEAFTGLFSPTVDSGIEGGLSAFSDAPGVQGEGMQNALLEALLSVMNQGVQVQEGPSSTAPDEPQKRGDAWGATRASPEGELAKLLARLLSQEESDGLSASAEAPPTALNRLERLLAQVLDGHSREQRGEDSTAEALSKMAFLEGAEEGQPGQGGIDAQEVRDIKDTLFEQRQAVVKRLAQLLGEMLAARKEGGQVGKKGGSPLAEGRETQRVLGIQELIEALQEGVSDGKEPRSKPVNLADLVERLMQEANSQDAGSQEGKVRGDLSSQPQASVQNQGEDGGFDLSSLLQKLVDDMGEDAKGAKSGSTRAGGPSGSHDSFPKVVQQLLSGGGEKGFKDESGSHLSWRHYDRGAFWQRSKEASGKRVSNDTLFSHALGKTISGASDQHQGSAASVKGANEVERVAQTIMETVKQVEVAKVGESHQMNIRVNLDGIHSLDISLSLSGQKEIALSFVADNSQVLHHLNSHAESLKAALQWHDLKVVSLSFNHPETGNHDYQQPQSGFGFHSFAQGSSQQSQEGGGFSGFFSNGGSEAPGSGSQDAPVPPVWSTDGLNIQA